MNNGSEGTREEKVSTMSVRLGPKLRYLVDLAAREDDCSLTRLIETAITAYLQNGPHLRNEGLWHEDAAMRLLLLTAKPDLLNDSERKLWRRIRNMPEVLDKSGNVDRAKLSTNWSKVTSNNQEG